jgi:hypothetical protein
VLHSLPSVAERSLVPASGVVVSEPAAIEIAWPLALLMESASVVAMALAVLVACRALWAAD